MFWHPRAEPFCIPAHVGQWQVPADKVAVIQHGGTIHVAGPDANMTFNTQVSPLWLKGGTRILFQFDVAGLLLPVDPAPR